MSTAAPLAQPLGSTLKTYPLGTGGRHREPWMFAAGRLAITGFVHRAKAFSDWLFTAGVLDPGGVVTAGKPFDDWMFATGTLDPGGAVIGARSFT